MARTTTYVLFRKGANGANQSLCDRAPVAIVVAASKAEAEQCDHDGSPHASAFVRLAPHVSVWANQHIEAVPLSRAPRWAVREIQENEAICGL